MPTKTASRRTKRAETKRAETKRVQGETEDQAWERTQRERAEAARDTGVKENERRVKMTPQEIAIDNAKKVRDAEAENQRWEALTQEERNAELDDPKSEHYEPLPPWQHRVGAKVIDARMQRIDLIYTDGTTPMGGERAEALEFLLDYMSSEAEAKT
jgi:hypothetical protein